MMSQKVIQKVHCGVVNSIVFCVLFSVSLWSAAEQAVPQLHVRGEAKLLVAADQVSITLGVVSEEKTAKKATLKNSQKMQAIITALKQLGLTDKDYKTQNFRVNPVWSSRPNNVGSQWRPKVIAYRVNNRLSVTTTKLAIVGELVADTLAAGANQVDSMMFSLSNPRQYRQQAIQQAMKNAKEDAQSLVQASGDKIVRTLSLHLDNTSATPIRARTEKMAHSRLMAADAASVPPIDSGDITVRASVSVVYELAK
jgi:uncharacterized protein YggE